MPMADARGASAAPGPLRRTLLLYLGALLAVYLANLLPTAGLKLGFGVFALVTCITMLRKKANDSSQTAPANPELMVAGLFIGHLSTLLGVSGGAMTVRTGQAWRQDGPAE